MKEIIYEPLHWNSRDANPLKETGDSLNVQYYPINRNSQVTVPPNQHLAKKPDVTASVFNFIFSFVLSSPRKERIIAIRDNLGRIVSSRPPEPVFALVEGGTPHK